MASLVLATDLEGVHTSRALAKAAQWFSVTLLAALALVFVLMRSSDPSAPSILWPMVWLAVVGAGVIVALRAERPWLGSVSVVVASGGGSFLYAMSLAPLLRPGEGSNATLLSLVKVAVVVAGVGGRSMASCLLMCSLGFGITGAGSIVAARHAGIPVGFDVPAFVTYVALVVLLVVLWRARGGASKGAEALNRAGAREQEVAEEARIISHASSVLHDTVLGDLHALARTEPGVLSEAHRDLIRRDLDLLARDAGLLLSPPPRDDDGPRRGEGHDHLGFLVAQSRSQGVNVAVTGDVAVLDELSAAAQQAVLAAIDQCLVNVSRHAGVDRAELAFAAVDNAVTVFVTDAGRGFDAGSTGAERLGLRLSVRERIQSLGGEVLVWSRPGEGTSILLTVPRSGAERAGRGE